MDEETTNPDAQNQDAAANNAAEDAVLTRPGIVVTWPSKDGGPAIDEKFKLPPITGDGVFVLTGVKGVPDVLEWKRFEEVEVTLCLDNAPKTGKVLFLEA